MQIKILDKILDKMLLPFLKFDKPASRGSDKWLPFVNDKFSKSGKFKIPSNKEATRDLLDEFATRKDKSAPYRSADYNLGKSDKILIIFGQQPSVLGGVEGVKDGKWYGVAHQRLEAGDKKLGYSKKELISIKKRIEKSADGSFHKSVAEFQKRYKDRVSFYDLGFYSLGKKHGLKYKSLYTIDDAINGKEYIQDFSELINMMNECEHLIYVGEANNGLDFHLFIDDFSTITVLSDDNLTFNDKWINIGQGVELSKFEDILKSAEGLLEEFDIDYSNPYGSKFEEIKNVWGRRMKNKKGVNPINDEVVGKLRKIYPFLNEIPDTVCESMWGVYAKDTTRASIFDNPSREDFFLDIFLMYSLFDWKNPNEFLIKRPKVFLTKAVLNNSARDILRFKKIIKKNSLVEG